MKPCAVDNATGPLMLDRLGESTILILEQLRSRLAKLALLSTRRHQRQRLEDVPTSWTKTSVVVHFDWLRSSVEQLLEGLIDDLVSHPSVTQSLQIMRRGITTAATAPPAIRAAGT
jgi:hypothetical protein